MDIWLTQIISESSTVKREFVLTPILWSDRPDGKTQHWVDSGRFSVSNSTTASPLCDLFECSRQASERRPIVLGENLPRDERRTDAQSRTSGLEEIRRVVQVHTAGWNDPQVGQRRVNRLDVTRTESVGWENLDEVRGGFVSQLCLGGRVSAQHDGATCAVRDFHQFRP